MKLNLLTLPALALALAACAPTELATRNQPGQPGLSRAAQTPQLALGKVRVDVPDSLVVAEGNSYYPMADIVWRGDAYGDRHAQVKAVFEAAAAQAATGPGRKADALIEVTRFHGVTERTRYSVGGFYSITFRLTLTDPATGAPIAKPRMVEARVPSGDPNKALADEHRGITEKVFVTSFLADTLRSELARPL